MPDPSDEWSFERPAGVAGRVALLLPSGEGGLRRRVGGGLDEGHREPDARNRALLRLLYAGGLRVSEACALRWRDLQPREDAGQVTVYGKGGKTRVVLLSPATWRVLLALRGAAEVGAGDEVGANATDRDAPVFPSRRGGGPLDQPQAWRLIQAATARVGWPTGKGGVSPHWLRPAHATHALEHGHSRWSVPPSLCDGVAVTAAVRAEATAVERSLEAIAVPLDPGGLVIDPVQEP